LTEDVAGIFIKGYLEVRRESRENVSSVFEVGVAGTHCGGGGDGTTAERREERANHVNFKSARNAAQGDTLWY